VPELPAPISRSSIGLREDSFVLCLASRAIEEKGWREAIEAAELLNARGRAVDLLLIGEGPLRDKLEASGDLPSYVRLIGQVPNLQDYISVSDAGLLPSYFSGESMPLVLIEFMAQGKPIVATDVGEVAWMIGKDDDRAGTIIPLEAGGVSAQSLADAIGPYVAKGATWQAAARGSRKQFEKFDMSTMLDRYGALYDEALERRRGPPVGEQAVPGGLDHFASPRQTEAA
jgi:glycosyltransferase involved in cell wall biosynthesis